MGSFSSLNAYDVVGNILNLAAAGGCGGAHRLELRLRRRRSARVRSEDGDHSAVRARTVRLPQEHSLRGHGTQGTTEQDLRHLRNRGIQEPQVPSSSNTLPAPADRRRCRRRLPSVSGWRRMRCSNSARQRSTGGAPASSSGTTGTRAFHSRGPETRTGAHSSCRRTQTTASATSFSMAATSTTPSSSAHSGSN